MTWTKDKPTEPGWYWWRPLECRSGYHVCQCSRCKPDIFDCNISDDGVSCIWSDIRDTWLPVEELGCRGGEWYGPLEVPE